MPISHPTPCQLYLVIPVLPSGSGEALVESALRGGPIAAALMTADAYAAFGEAMAKRIITLLQSAGTATLLEEDAALTVRLGADGIHIKNPGAEGAAIKAARQGLPPGGIVGAEAGLSRHRAMINGESGADYVSFNSSAAHHHEIGQIEDIVHWWSELFELPCVAGHQGGLEEAGRLARAGADFLAASEWVWQHEGGPEAAVRALNKIFGAAD